jgi:hypothetical protein
MHGSFDFSYLHLSPYAFDPCGLNFHQTQTTKVDVIHIAVIS